MMKRLITLSFLIPFLFLAKGQDIRFSQYFSAPQLYNPAFTSSLKGDLRATAIHKSQWQDPYNAYRTTGGGIDLGIGRIKMRGSGFGVGMHVFSDQAGDLNFNTNQIMLSTAYSQKLGDYKPNVLSAGFQLQVANRYLDMTKAKFDPDQGGETDFVGIDNYWYVSLGAGLLWFYEPKDRIHFYIGLSGFNLLRPDQSFYTDGRDRLMARYVAQGGLQFEPNSKWVFNPSMLYQRQGPFQDVLLGALLKYKFQEDYKMKLHIGGGLWHRVGDAFTPMVRIEYNDLTTVFSYDINISSLARTNRANGGPEISLVYNGFWSSTRKKNLLKQNSCRCPFL